ncbi:MAG TPA: acetoin utilization protein AcuC [Gammaproteobacteria bacterium]
METCLYLGEALAAYQFGEGHPFGPLRYGAFVDELQRRGLQQRVCLQSPLQASEAQLEWFHTHDYVMRVKRQSASGEGLLDFGDTPAFKGVFEAAATVVGSVLDALQRIMDGECRNAFVPIAGLHHARRGAAAGFCVFNDCGVAIEALRREHGIHRVAYVDIDAHHGDGVYYAFADDPELFIVDFHEDGRYLYPGSGAASETGDGVAKGSKLNIPLPPGADDRMVADLWGAAEAFIRQARPEFIILQCGADSLAGDPLTHLAYSAATHRMVAERVGRLAADQCEGRLLALGGGGYLPGNIAAAWCEVVEALLGGEVDQAEPRR